MRTVREIIDGIREKCGPTREPGSDDEDIPYWRRLKRGAVAGCTCKLVRVDGTEHPEGTCDVCVAYKRAANREIGVEFLRVDQTTFGATASDR